MITLIKIPSLCICCGLPIEENKQICKLCEEILQVKEENQYEKTNRFNTLYS